MPRPFPQVEGDSSDDDSIDWDMSDGSVTSSDSEGETRERVAGEYPYTAEYFLKKKLVLVVEWVEIVIQLKTQ